MFKKLFEFGYTRSAVEAIGFYIVWLLLFVCAGGIVGAIIGFVTASTSPETLALIMRSALLLVTVLTAVLGFKLLQKKRLFKSPLALILSAVGIVLTLFGGALFGLIPFAFITTLAPKSDEKEGEPAV